MKILLKSINILITLNDKHSCKSRTYMSDMLRCSLDFQGFLQLYQRRSSGKTNELHFRRPLAAYPAKDRCHITEFFWSFPLDLN